MSKPSDWALAFARQSTADIRAWELYEQHPELVAADCHKLLFLQMACEKLCKASLIRAGAKPGDLQASHGYTAKHLPIVVGRQIMESGSDLRRMRGIITLTRHLAMEIELLNPSVRRGGGRHDNCEYPWLSGNRVVSPLDWTFQPLRLVAQRGGPTFPKLLKSSITSILKQMEK